MATIHSILESMRAGEEQDEASIGAFITGLVSGEVSRPQAAAWLAFAYMRGLSERETAVLTRSMTASGTVLEWPDGPLLIDKHSTGGVGDKVSLVLAPVWAALGFRVPMISGRGLGHTGGTLDKLEAIAGYRTNLDEEELRRVLATAGAFISGQTGDVAPADRVLYALRNETCTVPSIPLICGSILSKKLAEGVQRLVLDVKVGSGGFMPDLQSAKALADTLVQTATANGVHCEALLTAMDRPLGRSIGNAHEVRESVDCLKGGGPPDLREMVLELAMHPGAASVLDDGTALDCFAQMVECQGGDPGFIDDPGLLLGSGTAEHVLCASQTGFIAEIGALEVGRAAVALGAGRIRAEDPVDHGVGMDLLVGIGEAVQAGQPLVRIAHRNGAGLHTAEALLEKAFVFSEGPCSAGPLVLGKVSAR